jgi:hypothetical protein
MVDRTLVFFMLRLESLGTRLGEIYVELRALGLVEASRVCSVRDVDMTLLLV